MERWSEADQWTHQLAPPYAEHIIETTVSSMLDEQLRFRVLPSPKLYQTPDEIELARKGARAHEILMRQQMKAERFDEKIRSIVLQERLAGMCPVKVYWHQSAKKRKRLTTEPDPELGVFPVLRVTEQSETIYDGPCVEVCDVRDWFWDDQATSLETAGIVAHRVWPTIQEARRQQRLGYWKNVSELPDTEDFAANLEERERGDFDHKSGRIEVLEIWRREDNGIRVYTIGNRTVLLAERDNPFWHGEMPFVVFVGQSRPFRIPGRAQIEKLRDLQTALWSVANQRLDNLMFVNNAIALISSDVEDPDAFEWYPGARWVVDRPEQVTMWNPSPVPAQISIPAESMLKADMQNLAGGFPFTSSSEAQTVNANTATEASLVASLAQRSIVGAKQQLYHAYRRIGQMRLELNQQFVREPVYSLVVGANDRWEQEEIIPQMLQGEFLFDIEPMTESLMRQERRSEAISLFQALVPAVQMLMMTGAALNTRKLVENVLEAFDMHDLDAWFAPPQQGPPGMAPPAAGTPPGMVDPNAGGVTNPNTAAGMLAPSNENSMAPAMMMQQFLADGTGRNA